LQKTYEIASFYVWIDGARCLRKCVQGLLVIGKQQLVQLPYVGGYGLSRQAAVHEGLEDF
jgi:hypothetical protein